jgi:hypothetical protein
LAAVGLSGDLALVQSGVPGLREFDLQRPVLGGSRLDDSEPLVGCVRVSTHSQDVHVTVPDPAHLHQQERKEKKRKEEREKKSFRDYGAPPRVASS